MTQKSTQKLVLIPLLSKGKAPELVEGEGDFNGKI
mgnify:CR=1 FL=1